jgi:hypothetical protein
MRPMDALPPEPRALLLSSVFELAIKFSICVESLDVPSRIVPTVAPVLTEASQVRQSWG